MIAVSKKKRQLGPDVHRDCVQCGVTFLVKQWKKGFYSSAETCSRKCWAARRSQTHSDGRMVLVASFRQPKPKRIVEAKPPRQFCCLWCGAFVATTQGNAKFCTIHECRKERAAFKQRQNVVLQRPAVRECRCCGGEFGNDRPNGTDYCSKACSKRVSKRERRRRLRTKPMHRVGVLFIAKLFEYKCCKCGIKCENPSRKNLDNEASIDHIVPVVKGGSHTVDNMQLLCRKCNYSKRDAIVDYRDHTLGAVKSSVKTKAVDTPPHARVFFAVSEVPLGCC